MTTEDGSTNALLTDPLDETVSRLVANHAHACVVGLQFGDEGKGQVVDALTGYFDLVVRYNGGNNAGHSVRIGEQKFALHLIPSGVLNPKAVNVVGNGVVIDPEGIVGEIDALTARGVTIGDNLRISDRAHVVMPYHKLQDRLMELVLGRLHGQTAQIGTTGRGIGPCYADKAQRTTAIRMHELIDEPVLRRRLHTAVEVKNVMLAALAAHVGEPFDRIDPDALFEQYRELARRLAPHVCDTTQLLTSARLEGRRILFEGANAALLDIDHGTFPYVTSSNTTSLGIYPGAAVPGGTVGEVLGVAKCYTSRVGGGPSATQIEDQQVADHLRQVGNEFGTTTGRPRRIGWMDLVAVRYAAKLNGCTGIVCTGLSVLCDLPALKVCVGYRVDGRELTHFPADAGLLERVEPIYQTVEGFAGPIDHCRRYEDLPAGARAYIEAVEAFVGVPVRAVCVGPAREQIIPRKASAACAG